MAGQADTTKVVIFALVGNFAIAVAKFVAYFFTASSAMLAEAFHSLADTGNQGLMLFGLHRAKRPPDREHPYGYGKETYFWSFVVAISIFTIGAVVAFYEGGHKLIAVFGGHSGPPKSQLVAFIVLGVSILIEGYVALAALKEFRKVAGGRGTVAAIQETRKVPLVTVLFEDMAAVAGLFIALVGVTLTALTGNGLYDAVATLLIGVILSVVAFFLAWMTKRLLIGHSASADVEQRIADAVNECSGVEEILELKTLHFGGDYVLLNLGIHFKDGMITDELEVTIDEIEKTVKAQVPVVQRIFIEVDSFITRQPDPPTDTDKLDE